MLQGHIVSLGYKVFTVSYISNRRFEHTYWNFRADNTQTKGGLLEISLFLVQDA